MHLPTDLWLFLLVAFALAILGVGGLAAVLIRRYRAPLPPAPAPTQTAEDLLHDLTHRGQALIRIEVIDPKNLLLRRPRS